MRPKVFHRYTPLEWEERNVPSLSRLRQSHRRPLTFSTDSVVSWSRTTKRTSRATRPRSSTCRCERSSRHPQILRYLRTGTTRHTHQLDSMSTKLTIKLRRPTHTDSPSEDSRICGEVQFAPCYESSRRYRRPDRWRHSRDVRYLRLSKAQAATGYVPARRRLESGRPGVGRRQRGKCSGPAASVIRTVWLVARDRGRGAMMPRAGGHVFRKSRFSSSAVS